MGILVSRNCNNDDNETTPTLPATSALINHHHLSEITHIKNQKHIRQGSVRSRIYVPMPDSSEVDKRFTRVLASMDLPPDKAKLLRNYDDDKKWSIICDKEMVSAKDPPLHYLTKLRTYLDPKASRSHRKRKMVGESTSTQVLRDLEISLRTNHIEWVKEFLDYDNQGLDALIDYLSFRLLMMRHEQKLKDDQNGIGNGTTTTTEVTSTSSELNNEISSTNNSRIGGINEFIRPRFGDLIESPILKRRSRHIVKLNMGTATDDIHVCIMCLRAIMNNKYGFNMVIQHREAINNIALSIIHKSLRTKALVLELLAAICLVKGGHEIILAAFDNFKEVYQEQKRFHTLMNYFINYELFNIDFMVACMQFINIIVHSVEDMNYRVHLQYEFTSLDLDNYLEKLRLTESEELQVQISAYLDNVFDVASLMEDGETKTAALDRVQELEESLGRALDRSAEFERDALYKLSDLESEMTCLRNDHKEYRTIIENQEKEIIILQNILKENNQKLKNTHNLIENAKTQQFEYTQEINENNNNKVSSIKLSSSQPPPQPPPPPAPPMDMITSQNNPMLSSSSVNTILQNNNDTSKESKNFLPNPPPIIPKAPLFMSPPIVGLMPAPDGAMTIKRKVQTKYKLPSLNWVALKPNQVRGTIFSELDDEKIFKNIDFLEFEEKFKIGFNYGIVNNNSELDGLSTFPSKRIKKADNISLLDHSRLRNIAIFLKKLNCGIDAVVKSINNLDLKTLSFDKVEILTKMTPTEDEIKLYRRYVSEKKDINHLTEEDKFMLQLTKIERISQKLYIMHYMGSYFETLNYVVPQIYAIKNASNSIKSSDKFKALLEIILAFGNYLNSSKRGPAYGFKLQSLDNLVDTKSTDKKTCLLHYIAKTVRQKFPDLLTFDTELFCIEEAMQFSLENIFSDIAELEKGMESVKKEIEVGSKGIQNHILKEFLLNSDDKLCKLHRESAATKVAFKDCVEYFGETLRNTEANSFFALIVRFIKAFKVADLENEQRKRLELATALAMEKKDLPKVLSKQQQQVNKEAVINELKSKSTVVQEKKLLHQDEVYNGALEDILSGLKSEPYRRADAVRRSHRRRIDSNRLSKNMEELQL